MGGTSSEDEMVEVLVAGLGVVGRKRLSGSIGQLVVSLSKVPIPLEDDCGVALISRENKDVGIGMEVAKG